jgi:hypothetical protein
VGEYIWDAICWCKGGERENILHNSGERVNILHDSGERKYILHGNGEREIGINEQADKRTMCGEVCTCNVIPTVNKKDEQRNVSVVLRNVNRCTFFLFFCPTCFHFQFECSFTKLFVNLRFSVDLTLICFIVYHCFCGRSHLVVLLGLHVLCVESLWCRFVDCILCSTFGCNNWVDVVEFELCPLIWVMTVFLCSQVSLIIYSSVTHYRQTP